MDSMMKLALAEMREQVEKACASSKTGKYDILNHVFVREVYTVVYLTNKGIACDIHRHYIEGAVLVNILCLLRDFISNIS